VLVDVALHVALIYDHFRYSQLIYDTVVSPFYKAHEDTINALSKKLEGYFEKKTQEVQSRVSQNATDSNPSPTQRLEASSETFSSARSTPPAAARNARNDGWLTRRRCRRARRGRTRRTDDVMDALGLLI
jgi:hypothetical protein